MQDFHKLRVYQEAHRLAIMVYGTADSLPVAERYGLMSQMRRAAVSVVSNIAEGAGRGGKDFRRFLRMALGSTFELESQLRFCCDLQYVGPSDLDVVVKLANDLQKMLISLIGSIHTNNTEPTIAGAKSEERGTEDGEP